MVVVGGGGRVGGGGSSVKGAQEVVNRVVVGHGFTVLRRRASLGQAWRGTGGDMRVLVGVKAGGGWWVKTAMQRQYSSLGGGVACCLCMQAPGVL